VILHLLVGMFFFYAKITSLYNQSVQIKIETPESIKQEILEKQKEIQKKISINKLAESFIASQKRSNIGVNVSGKDPAQMEKDLQQVQQEVDAARKQIASIAENLEKQDKVIKTESKESEAISSGKPEKIQGKLVVYKGPTNIYFDLANRRQIDLYIPVYKCQGNGKVIVNIVVNPAGEVEDAVIDKLNSNNDECLFTAAQYAALKSRFNTDFKNAPVKQKGTITYLFVAQ
jgi:outer membrane biosynthesis protein TonB